MLEKTAHTVTAAHEYPIITMIKCTRMRWAWHVVLKGEIRSSCTVSVEKPERKIRLGEASHTGR
jgi:hypothetical protein